MKTHINGNTIEQVMTNAVTLTQAQYDLLPLEQKNHGTYIISDSVCPNISATNVDYDENNSVKDKIDDMNNVEVLTITGKVTDVEGQHFIKNGIAYFFGNMQVNQNLTSGLLGTFNVSVYGGNSGIGQWIGYNKTKNDSMIGGYLVNNQIIYNVGTIENGDIITMFTTFRVEEE